MQCHGVKVGWRIAAMNQLRPCTRGGRVEWMGLWGNVNGFMILIGAQDKKKRESGKSGDLWGTRQ